MRPQPGVFRPAPVSPHSVQPKTAQAAARPALPPAPVQRPTPPVYRPAGNSPIQARLVRFVGNRLRSVGGYDRQWWNAQVSAMGAYIYSLQSELGLRYHLFLADLESDEDIMMNHLHDRCIARVEHWVATAQRDVQAQQQNPTPFTLSGLLPSPHTTFTYSTQNMEKYGQATDKAPKSEETVRNARTFAPDVALHQEITDSKLFVGDIKERLPDYEPLHGASYQSYNYKESYPGLFNTATVHSKPEFFYIDPKSGQEKPYKSTLYFGKEAANRAKKQDLKQARPTSFWKLKIPADRYNLRPPQKYFSDPSKRADYDRLHVNLKHRRDKPYRTVRLLNVHTSPGRSTPTIKKQVDAILEDVVRMRRKHPNTAAVGDFYMQRGSRINWRRLMAGYRGAQTGKPWCEHEFQERRGQADRRSPGGPGNMDRIQGLRHSPIAHQARHHGAAVRARPRREGTSEVGG